MVPASAQARNVTACQLPLSDRQRAIEPSRVTAHDDAFGGIDRASFESLRCDPPPRSRAGDGKAPGAKLGIAIGWMATSAGSGTAGQTCAAATYLWQHTCFEVFLRPDGSDGYHGVQFFAVRRLGGYRFARTPPRNLAHPNCRRSRVECRRLPDGCTSAQIAIDGATNPRASKAIDAGTHGRHRDDRRRALVLDDRCIAANNPTTTIQRHSRFECERRNSGSTPPALDRAVSPLDGGASPCSRIRPRSRPTSRTRWMPCGREDFRLTAAFGPQHGLRGDKQDNMVESAGLHRPGPRHPGLQPVRRGAPADRRR